MFTNSALSPIDTLVVSGTNRVLLEGNLRALDDLISGLGLLENETFIFRPDERNASIGMHVRHVVEFYQEFFKSITQKQTDIVCYDNRQRNLELENSKNSAHRALCKIVLALQSYDLRDRNLELSVVVDPGQPLSTLRTTVHRELYHLLDHTTHHMAIIKIFADTHGITFDKNFGLANATKKNRQKNNR